MDINDSGRLTPALSVIPLRNEIQSKNTHSIRIGMTKNSSAKKNSGVDVCLRASRVQLNKSTACTLWVCTWQRTNVYKYTTLQLEAQRTAQYERQTASELKVQLWWCSFCLVFIICISMTFHCHFCHCVFGVRSHLSLNCDGGSGVRARTSRALHFVGKERYVSPRPFWSLSFR